jgi:pimeloyl-ACP methyl ester carboxylesterase
MGFAHFLVRFALIIAFFWSGQCLAQGAIQRPVVVVAGILGSKLCTATGEVVWGSGSSLGNLSRLQLNVSSPEPLTPCGLIERIEILGPLYSIKAYTALIDHLKRIGFSGNNVHFFSYDWRLSNFDTAKKFKAFIAERKADGRLPGDFDILAHSMGGIVTRIYLAETPDAPVRKVIYLGTPFLGSANTLGTLSEGWGTFANTLAGGMDTIREVVTSFPGFLDLLPRYKDCCYVRNSDRSRRNIDVFDANEWRTLNWLPAAIRTSPQQFAAFKRNLETSKTLNNVLRTSSPNVIELKIAGDAHPTRNYFGVRAAATVPSSDNWFFSKDKGDGTVPVWSAARDQSFSNLSGTLVSFSEHVTIFDDEWVKDTITRELRSVSPTRREPINGRGHPLITIMSEGAQRNWTIASIEVNPTQSTFRQNELFRADVVIALEGGEAGLKTGLVTPTAVFRTNTGELPLSVSEITQPGDIARRQLRFTLTCSLASVDPGSAEAVFAIPTVRDDASAVARIAILPN